MWTRGPGLGATLRTLLSATAVLAVAVDVGAGEWSLRVEALQMDAFGHDQHILNIHRIDPVARTEATTAVQLETDAGFAYRAELRYAAKRWTWGVDISVFYTDQLIPDRSAAAEAGAGEVVFEVVERSFSSLGPDDVLLFTVLEDTSLQTWTADLYGLRTLVEGPRGGLRLQLGIRNADFDNDYRAVVGLEGVGGRRIDASSNYGRMIGPLVGLEGSIDLGRSTFEGHLAGAVILGEVELSNRYRDFTGPLSDAMPVDVELPTVFASGTSRTTDDVAIPVVDLRLRWTYRVADWLGLSLGVDTSSWWDVPVPPGVIPGEGSTSTLHENTIVFFGLALGAQVTF